MEKAKFVNGKSFLGKIFQVEIQIFWKLIISSLPPWYLKVLEIKRVVGFLSIILNVRREVTKFSQITLRGMNKVKEKSRKMPGWNLSGIHIRDSYKYNKEVKKRKLSKS